MGLQRLFEASQSDHPHSSPRAPLQTITPWCGYSCKIRAVAPVAQMDRVAASEAAGRWFESNRARHLKQELTGTPSRTPHAPEGYCSQVAGNPDLRNAESISSRAARADGAAIRLRATEFR